MFLLPHRVGPAGAYTMQRKIGTGGVAESYKGSHDAAAGRAIVIRRLLPYVMRDHARMSSIEARIRDLLGVRHPFLVHVLDHVVEGDEHFLIEEYVEGVTLESVLNWSRQGGHQVPHNVFLNIATQVCNGLEALHGRSGKGTSAEHVLHLALKPSAIFLTREGKVLVGSYGLTRSPTTFPHGGVAGPVPTRMEYLSPEQTHPDQKLTPASDIFSLGAVLYELLTLDSLFRAESNLQTIHRVRRAEVTAHLLRVKERMPGLDKVLFRALSLNPRHRYQRAFVLREDLRGLMAGYSFATIGEDTRAFLGPLLDGQATSGGGGFVAGLDSAPEAQTGGDAFEDSPATRIDPDPMMTAAAAALALVERVARERAQQEAVGEATEHTETASGEPSLTPLPAAYRGSAPNLPVRPEPIAAAELPTAAPPPAVVPPAESDGDEDSVARVRLDSAPPAADAAPLDPAIPPEIAAAPDSTAAWIAAGGSGVPATDLPPAPPAPERPRSSSPTLAPAPSFAPPAISAAPRPAALPTLTPPDDEPDVPASSFPSLDPSSTAAHAFPAPPPVAPLREAAAPVAPLPVFTHTLPPPAPVPPSPGPSPASSAPPRRSALDRAPPPGAVSAPPAPTRPPARPPVAAAPARPAAPPRAPAPVPPGESLYDPPPPSRGGLFTTAALGAFGLVILCSGVSWLGYRVAFPEGVSAATAAATAPAAAPAVTPAPTTEAAPADAALAANTAAPPVVLPTEEDPATVLAGSNPTAAPPLAEVPVPAPVVASTPVVAPPAPAATTRPSTAVATAPKTTTSTASSPKSAPSTASSAASTSRSTTSPTPSASTPRSSAPVATTSSASTSRSSASALTSTPAATTAVVAVVAPSSELDAFVDDARKGKLSTTDAALLEGTELADPNYTRSRALLLMNAQKKGDEAQQKRILDQLMALPENGYSPIYLADYARWHVNRGEYERALEKAQRAERYWGRLPSDLVFSKKAEIFEVEAAAWQGRFYKSGDDVELLDNAIAGWERYKSHVASRSRADLESRASEQIAKLTDIRERMQ